jgi:ammonia channel protein AmtB
MGDWYTIGVALGLGTALGVLFAGLLSATPLGRIAAVVLAGAAGALAGAMIEDWTEIGGGVIGGLVGAVAAAVVVAGALRRGGTRGGLALIVAGIAAGLAVLAFVPVAGYLIAVAVPVLALRLRRTQSERYAGLRTLAKD